MRSYSNFPSQVVSDDEKMSVEYGLKVAQAIELEWFDDSGYNNRYLNDSNSIPFNDYDSIDIALERAVGSYSYTKDKTKKYEELLSERYAKEKLIPHFNKLYERHNMKFDGQLINCDNLSNRLPAHYLDVAWNHPTEPTADIKSNEQLNKFITYINNENNR